MENVIDRTVAFVKQELEGAEAGHDWFHIERVWKNSLLIAQTEECNLEVVQLAALLHDIADSKFHGGDDTVGPRKAREFMESIGLDAATIDHVVAIIENISFKGGNTNRTHQSIELDIAQDADRLDAIGAIGIIRAFHYGGFKNRTIYDPSISPKMGMSPAEYKKSDAPTINHFYEKLLLLKDRMNTETGKRIASERHQFMERFLAQFYSEWEGLA
jgi:uncharacterized protein